VRFYFSAVLLDSGAALRERRLLAVLHEILAYRLMQFWGAYRGNHSHRVMSRELKHRYFYPG
jgi:hypothetical protein